MLFGEYAVLDGAPALVAAVGRYAVGSGVEGEAAELARWTAEAHAVELDAEDGAKNAAPATAFEVDTSALREGEVKLGLGSSAAACVAGAALVVHRQGESLAGDVARRRIFRVARAVHDRMQGERGSGADIAASIEGGLLRYETADGGRWAHTRLPAQQRLVFVPTGVAASTRILVGRVRELRGVNPTAYGRRLGVLGELARELTRELSQRSAGDVCLFVHAYAAQLEALGREAGIAIVSEPHRRIGEIARAQGCAAKPSGAGGGDISVVFCPNAASAAAVRGALAEGGFPPIELNPDELGVRLQDPDAEDAT